MDTAYERVFRQDGYVKAPCYVRVVASPHERYARVRVSEKDEVKGERSCRE